MSGESAIEKIYVLGYDTTTPSSFSDDFETFSWLCKPKTIQSAVEACKKLDADSVLPGGPVKIKDDVHYKNYTLSFYDHDNVRIMSLNVDYTGIVTISLYSEEKDVYVLHGNGLNTMILKNLWEYLSRKLLPPSCLHKKQNRTL